MIVLRNSTVLHAVTVIDPAELTKRFTLDSRKWAIQICIPMRSSTAPTIPSSESSAYYAEQIFMSELLTVAIDSV